MLYEHIYISVLQGGKEYLMRAHFGLPSVEAEDKEGKPPISVKFEIPYFTTSGIQVCTSCLSNYYKFFYSKTPVSNIG